MSAMHEWLNLLEVSGPFLAVPVLREAFPQGLEELDASRAKRLRSAYEEWRDAVDGEDTDVERLHSAWIEEVLRTGLEVDDSVLRRGDGVPTAASNELPEHGTSIVPDVALVDPTHGDALLTVIHVFPPDTDLSASLKFDGLSCSPADRMALHLRALGIPLGIVTNGERWMLVHAPTGQVATFASWYARLWGQEQQTLRAFASLLSVRRFFAPEQDRLPALFERSLKHQDEVTEALGDQVRRAIEVLVQALDRADQDRNRELLRDVQPQELYEAGLTVMMRLVFFLAAEERGLLLLGEPRYDSFYAASTLRMQLRAESDEILERRRAAWSRLLAVFRAVYGGIDHPTLRLPAMGGSLFDPDRFPFLEGRLKGTSWRQHRAEPLPIDDRTVLLLLEAIQTFEGRTLSYRALDVEQIGHVYEGLLERTVARVEDVTIELEAGVQAKDARVTLGELESSRLDGQTNVVSLLVERSKRSESAIRNALADEVEPQQNARLLSACRGDGALRDRLKPYVRLMRTDPWGYPLVHPKGAFVVVLGADRRETGTHYTPKSLTEKIVEETLTPLVYDGPSKGTPRSEWKPKASAEILDFKVCDPAMGSGAFLVQACRFLSARLVETWAIEEAAGRIVDITGQVHEPRSSVDAMPLGAEVRAEHARRIVAERCLYGVDLNPLAVELAKLSLWLVTLSKGRPFGFLDHNLRSGDSLLGIDRIEQLTELSMEPTAQAQGRLFGKSVRQAVNEALAIRQQVREMPIRDIRDVEAMASLDAAARSKMATSAQLADTFIGLVFATEGAQGLEKRLVSMGVEADRASQGSATALTALKRQAVDDLSKEFINSRTGQPFHWPLEFPEVFLRPASGFDAFVGNPPFLGNRLWKGTHGRALKRIVEIVLRSAPGTIDLCIAFHRRVVDLLRVSGGAYGLLATSNIAEGSSITVGLGEIVKRGEIYYSRKGLKWPGKASVVVAIVIFHKGEWHGRKNADGRECDRIGPRLQCETGVIWKPQALENAMFSFEGVNNSQGLAFVVTPDSPWFQPLRSEPDSLLKPYITGDDITSYALNRPGRWALDIMDRSLEEIARRWPLAHRFLVEVVEPTRSPETLKSYGDLHKRWWQFSRHRTDLLHRLRGRDHFLGYSKHTKFPIGMLCDSDWIYINSVLLIALERSDQYSICLSSFFTVWLETYSSRHLSNVFRLSISESVDTFPNPAISVSNTGIKAALRLNKLAVTWSADHDCGLTKVMNAIHSPESVDERIRELRVLLETIDAEVASAYGWTGMDMSHNVRKEVDGEGLTIVRYGLDAATRGQVLAKLSALNRAHYEASVTSRTDCDVRNTKRRRSTRRSSVQGSLVVDEPNAEKLADVARAKKVRVQR